MRATPAERSRTWRAKGRTHGVLLSMQVFSPRMLFPSAMDGKPGSISVILCDPHHAGASALARLSVVSSQAACGAAWKSRLHQLQIDGF
jgi:hypothetical protein